jgi:2-oxoglutarate/2-oxoacid ferredoxin oxidoreductase subunit beta
MSDSTEVQSERPILNAEVEAETAKVRESGILGYRSEALPTWCPGCGYYAINHAMTRAMNDLGIENRNLVLVSGIGCAGRFPFFVNGYGFHAIHGRAVPVACGVKIANPALTVVVTGGDGDGLGIGGGHLPHAMRRNVDLTYILFDNGIYGLTKGQTSPTTPLGQVTSTHPYGNPDRPLDAVTLALAYRGSFVARGYAGEPEDLYPLFRAAFEHRGFSFVIVYTPCVTFDKVNITYERMRDLWHPLPEDHDPTDAGRAMQYALSDTLYHGVFYQESRPTFEGAERETAAKAGV